MKDFEPLDRRQSPSRLYRNQHDGVLFGVCAGVADYFGIGAVPVRLAALFGLIIFFLPTLFSYLLGALFLPPKPVDLYDDPGEEQFWRAVRTEPSQTAHALRQRFRELDSRLQALETAVTSQAFQLGKTIDRLRD